MDDAMELEKSTVMRDQGERRRRGPCRKPQRRRSAATAKTDDDNGRDVESRIRVDLCKY